MIDHGSVSSQVRDQYDDGKDPSFRSLIAVVQPADDGELGKLIEIDGRLRLTLGRDVNLDRYLDAAPLEERPVALDAAIDVSLRAMSRRSAPGTQDIESLVESYPHLERAIREAVMLGQALRSTTSMRRRVNVEKPLTKLPGELGPKLPDGRARYELVELVGEGGTGDVYRAIDRHLSDGGSPATVAVKIFSPPEDEAFAQWMREEALKARRVDHESVVRALDRGETDEGASYIVYEFIGGGDLGELIRRRGLPFPAREAARLMAEIARGVQAIHSAGLVHCDLKPGNIAMTAAGRPKVADFGIAMREGQSPKINLSEPGSPLGNLAFISPEQFRGDPGAYSSPSDVYALGGMLAYLVTGLLPNGATREEISARHQNPQPLTLDDRLDRDLRRIIARATAAEPSQRYASANEFADDLTRWEQRRPLAWGRTGPARRSALFARRRPVLTGVGVLAVLAMSLAAGIKIREDMRRNTVADLVYEMMDFYVDTDVGGENLAALAVWEAFSRASYIGDPPLSRDLRQIELLRTLVEMPEIAAAPDSSDALFYRSALALALVYREGDYLEGEPLARECREQWAKIFGDNDVMVRRMAVVEAAAAVHRALASHEAGGDLGELAKARAALQAASDRLPQRDDRGPLPKLVNALNAKLDAAQDAAADAAAGGG